MDKAALIFPSQGEAEANERTVGGDGKSSEAISFWYQAHQRISRSFNAGGRLSSGGDGESFNRNFAYYALAENTSSLLNNQHPKQDALAEAL